MHEVHFLKIFHAGCYLRRHVYQGAKAETHEETPKLVDKAMLSVGRLHTGMQESTCTNPYIIQGNERDVNATRVLSPKVSPPQNS